MLVLTTPIRVGLSVQLWPSSRPNSFDRHSSMPPPVKQSSPGPNGGGNGSPLSQPSEAIATDQTPSSSNHLNAIHLDYDFEVMEVEVSHSLVPNPSQDKTTTLSMLQETMVKKSIDGVGLQYEMEWSALSGLMVSLKQLLLYIAAVANQLTSAIGQITKFVPLGHNVTGSRIEMVDSLQGDFEEQDPAIICIQCSVF